MKTSKPNMRQEQAAETRRKLLESARALFAKNGYAGTPVRSINREIDMADGLLYHYFPGGKKEIFQVLMKEGFHKTVIGIRSYNDLVENLSLEQVLDHLYRFWDEVFSEHLELLKILLKENETMELVEIDALKCLLEERRQWIAEFLERRHQQGEIKYLDFEMAADHIMTICISNIMNKMLPLDNDLICDAQKREKSIQFMVNLWKNP